LFPAGSLISSQNTTKPVVEWDYCVSSMVKQTRV